MENAARIQALEEKLLELESHDSRQIERLNDIATRLNNERQQFRSDLRYALCITVLVPTVCLISLMFIA